MEFEKIDNSQNKSENEKKGEDVKQEEKKTNSIDDDKAITVLSYVGLLFLVPLLAKKDSPFAQFHAKQGLVLTIGWFVGGFLYLFFFLGALIHLGIVILSIMGIIDVLSGRQKDLPLVGNFAKKFNI